MDFEKSANSFETKISYLIIQQLLICKINVHDFKMFSFLDFYWIAKY